jgi:hypothetical protein
MSRPMSGPPSPPKLSRHQQREAIERRDAGETMTDIVRTYGVSHTTIMRLRRALMLTQGRGPRSVKYSVNR